MHNAFFVGERASRLERTLPDFVPSKMTMSFAKKKKSAITSMDVPVTRALHNVSSPEYFAFNIPLSSAENSHRLPESAATGLLVSPVLSSIVSRPSASRAPECSSVASNVADAPGALEAASVAPAPSPNLFWFCHPRVFDRLMVVVTGWNWGSPNRLPGTMVHPLQVKRSVAFERPNSTYCS